MLLPRDNNQPGADRAAIGHESNYPDCLEHSQATTPQLGITDEGSRVSLTASLAKLNAFLFTSKSEAECRGSSGTSVSRQKQPCIDL